MSRFNSSGSNNHRVTLFAGGPEYLISWQVDRYYSDSRLRHPRRCSRVTDEVGARRFIKRHNVADYAIKVPALKREGK